MAAYDSYYVVGCSDAFAGLRQNYDLHICTRWVFSCVLCDVLMVVVLLRRRRRFDGWEAIIVLMRARDMRATDSERDRERRREREGALHLTSANNGGGGGTHSSVSLHVLAGEFRSELVDHRLQVINDFHSKQSKTNAHNQAEHNVLVWCAMLSCVCAHAKR